MSASLRQAGSIGAAMQFATTSAPKFPRASDHHVQFYEGDDFLIQSLSSYVAKSVAEGHSIVLLLTPKHRTALEQSLLSAGIDPLECQRRGLYNPYDALQTLGSFMIGDHPGSRRFRAALDPIIENARRHGLPVCVCCEMVAILWAQEKKTAALELEILWNDLMDNVPFTLTCAHPITRFSDRDKNRELHHICRAHNCVIPHESYYDPIPKSAGPRTV